MVIASAALVIIIAIVPGAEPKLAPHRDAVMALKSPRAVDSRTAYTVVGNHIENARGEAVVLHGVNRSSLENSCTGATVTGQETGIPASDFATMHDVWGATVVRLPLDQDFWITNCDGYRATVNRAVREITANHMIAILDLHWWTRSAHLRFAEGGQGLCMPNDNSLVFWKEVAEAYRHTPTTWFELYNEPAPLGNTLADQWNIWRNGGSVSCDNNNTRAPMGSFNAAGMQQLADVIRGTGATNIILADGIDKAFTLEGVPLLSGNNIAYAIHPYDPEPLYTYLGWGESDWNKRFGNLAQRVPVLATEFGDGLCGDTALAHAYDEKILRYFRAHQISYMAWDWFAAYDCEVPELVNNAAGECKPRMGCVIQQNMKSYMDRHNP